MAITDAWNRKTHSSPGQRQMRGRQARMVLPVASVLTAATAALSLATSGTASASTIVRQAVEIQLPANASPFSYGFLFGADCTGTGSCVAGGSYLDSQQHQQAMLATESNGHSARAFEVRLPATRTVSGAAQVTAVACGGTRSCVAVGYFLKNSSLRGFVATRSGGAWHRAFTLPVPANSGSHSSSRADAVACTAPGDCTVIGNYTDKWGHYQSLAVTETAGKWQNPTELRMPGNAAKDPEAFVVSVSCLAAGSCSAVGDYVDKQGHFEVLAVSEGGGKWRTGVEITMPRGATANPYGDLSSVGCTGTGSCLAVGSYRDHGGGQVPMEVAESHGTWARARAVTLSVPNASATPQVALHSVACKPGGPCLVAAGYRNKASRLAPMVTTESAGHWSAAARILLPSNAASGTQLYGGISAAACSPKGYCIVVGGYDTNFGRERAMAATVRIS